MDTAEIERLVEENERLKLQAARAAYALREQTKVIEELRVEIERLQGCINHGHDSLSCLLDIMTDPQASLSAKTRAAAAAVGYQHPRLTVVAQADYIGLGERLHAARMRVWGPEKLIEQEPKLIEQEPDPAA